MKRNCVICNCEFEPVRKKGKMRKTCSRDCRRALCKLVKVHVPAGVITSVDPYWIPRSGSSLVGRL